MNAIDMVYNGIYKGAKAKGASEFSAVKHANMGVKRYKQSAFTGKTVGKMIEGMITDAVKESKQPKKKAVTVIPAKPKQSKPKPKTKTRPISNRPSSFASQTVRDRTFKSDDQLWSVKL